MEKATDERALLSAWTMRLLKRPVQIEAYQALGSGISGAATYRLTIDGTDAVLKLTLAGSASYVCARARREIAFYREIAARLPLRVPRVIGMHADAEGYALLLAAYEPSPPPAAWRDDLYLAAVRQLACFHATFWNKIGELHAYPWLLRSGVADSDREAEQAREYWHALGTRPQLEGILTVQREHWIYRLLDGIKALDALIAALPLTLCHGDCNPGNVLVAPDGDLVWADWQEVRVAPGPVDLSFLLQQAAVFGGNVPYNAALAAYRDTLSQETGQDISLSLLRHAVAALELRSRVLHWPAYMREASPDELEAMLDRIRYLAAVLSMMT